MLEKRRLKKDFDLFRADVLTSVNFKLLNSHRLMSNTIRLYNIKFVAINFESERSKSSLIDNAQATMLKMVRQKCNVT